MHWQQGEKEAIFIKENNWDNGMESNHLHLLNVEYDYSPMP